ncbi:MAG: succinylglutamate desuccinylase/aspartoacylase family protein [Phycisphaerales bacterium]
MDEALAGEHELGVIESRELGSYDPGHSGPTLVIVGGVHGNEPAGVLAFRAVLERLLAHRPEAFRGKLIGLAGNIAALNDPDRRTRYVDADLNRLMTPELLASDADLSDLHEARALAAALRDAKDGARGPLIVIDLHTVSSPSPPFVAMSDALPARAIARHFPLPVFLAFEEHLEGLVADFATTQLGAVSMIIEGGQHDDPMSVEVLEAVIWTALHGAGNLEIGAGPDLKTDPRQVLLRAAGERARRVYDIRHRYAIESDDFAIEPGRRAFDAVKRGKTVVARDRGEPVVAAMSGRLFMPNRQPVRRVGDDGYFIAVEVGRGWLQLSARLRTMGWVHRALPRVLPGVRARAGRPGELIIAPEIAAVYRRQLFHLLGYRLIRSSPVPGLSPGQRIARGVRALAGSVASILRGVGRGGERAALPDERPDDWIAARRTLDVLADRDRSA